MALFYRGVSSGVLCVIFGIYEKLVDSVLGIFKDFKKNFLFLLPIAIGVFIGVIVFGNILKYLFTSFEDATKVLFIGLILGSIPSLFKQATLKKGFRLHFLIYSLFSFLLSMFLIYLENSSNIFTNINSGNNFLFFVIAGFAMSAGVVIPGVSSSAILMIMGIYYTYLEALSILNLHILIPMGIGLILGSLLFLFIIKMLLHRFYPQTFFAIIGFVIASCSVLIPSNSFSLSYLLLFFIGITIALKFEK